MKHLLSNGYPLSHHGKTLAKQDYVALWAIVGVHSLPRQNWHPCNLNPVPGWGELADHAPNRHWRSQHAKSFQEPLGNTFDDKGNGLVTPLVVWHPFREFDV